MANPLSIVADPSVGPRHSDGAVDGSASETATGRVFILSGPSGVGKDSVKKALKEAGFPLGYCVTATTRERKQDEVHGVDYEFVTEDEFRARLGANEMLEHAIVHGKHYGIPRRNLRAGLLSGHDVLVTPDVQGAATLRAHPDLDEVITIFLTPTEPKLDPTTLEPDPRTIEELGKRLRERDRETPEERAVRLDNAAREMKHLPEYDYVVVNEKDRLPQTVDVIKAIICAERSRVRPRMVAL